MGLKAAAWVTSIPGSVVCCSLDITCDLKVKMVLGTPLTSAGQNTSPGVTRRVIISVSKARHIIYVVKQGGSLLLGHCDCSVSLIYVGECSCQQYACMRIHRPAAHSSGQVFFLGSCKSLHSLQPKPSIEGAFGAQKLLQLLQQEFGS